MTTNTTRIFPSFSTLLEAEDQYMQGENARYSGNVNIEHAQILVRNAILNSARRCRRFIMLRNDSRFHMMANNGVIVIPSPMIVNQLAYLLKAEGFTITYLTDTELVYKVSWNPTQSTNVKTSD